MKEAIMKNIIDVYLLYGFELAEETKDYLVFTYTNGYFSNAEIVKLNDKDCSKCKEKYESLSYSVTKVDNVHLSISRQGPASAC